MFTEEETRIRDCLISLSRPRQNLLPPPLLIPNARAETLHQQALRAKANLEVRQLPSCVASCELRALSEDSSTPLQQRFTSPMSFFLLLLR